ncbi:MAG TPA: hypothetical protein VF523_01775 [Burkholderiales bacterium]
MKGNWFKSRIAFAIIAWFAGMQAGMPDANAANLIAQAKQFAVPARAYPELTQINGQVASLTARLEANTNQLREYRKARIRPTDRRYSALTREFNQTRSRLSEVERKLDRAPALDLNRFPGPAGSDRGSVSTADRERALAPEIRKYDQAKAALRQSIKLLCDHYDQQLREIARLR